MRKLLLVICTVLVVALAVGVGVCTSQEPIVIKYSSYAPKALYEACDLAWAKEIEKASAGRIKFKMFPYQQLLEARAHLDGIRTGIADCGRISTPYYPGRFPMSDITFLPLTWETGVIGAPVLHKLYDKYLWKEFEDNGVKCLIMEGSGEYSLASRKPIKNFADLKGLKMRSSGIFVADMMKRTGMLPVDVTAPELYSALQTGVLDVISYHWLGIYGNKLFEPANHIYEMKGGTLFGKAVFPIVFGLKSWNKLPNDIQNLIVDVSKSKYWCAEAYDMLNQKSKKELKSLESSGDIKWNIGTKEDRAKALEIAAEVSENWIKTNADKGPTREIYSYFYRLLQEAGLR